MRLRMPSPSAGALGDLYEFDPAATLWRNLTNLTRRGEAPSARFAAGFTAVAERLYLFGGQDEYGSELRRFEF